MNIVHNCLDKWLATDVRDRPALHWEGEEGLSATLTYAELAAEVNRCANALRSLGLRKGDAVGLYMPMIPELAIAFLAIIKIGGIILPLFSGYGPGAMVARLADADAKALITADGLLPPRPESGDEGCGRPGGGRGGQHPARGRRQPRRPAGHTLDAGRVTTGGTSLSPSSRPTPKPNVPLPKTC